jgi:hypothetical protein
MKEKIITLSIIKTNSAIIFSSIAFFIPFIFSGPQLVTGTIVNTLLILSSFKFSKTTILPVILLPSVGAISHGVVFGPLTSFLIFFLPVIWISNFLFIYSFNFFKKNYSLYFSLLISSVIKAALLYLFAILYFNFSLVPKIFIPSMGLIQLITAISGGVFGITIYKLWMKKIN